MPKPAVLTGLGIALLIMLCVWLGLRGDDAKLRLPAGRGGQSVGQRVDVEAQARPLVAKVGGRGADVASRVRSVLQAAPGEVAMLRLPADRWQRLLTPEQAQERHEGLMLTTIERDRVSRELEEILRQGGTLDPRIDTSGEEIAWKGEGISFEGEVVHLDATARIRMRIDDRLDGGTSFESIARVPRGAMVLIALPESGGDGVLMVLGEDRQRIAPSR